MPRVTVVIPTYNRADLVCEAIDSVLAQTYCDFEIIVVDDGSTDRTQEVVSVYGQRIRVIRQENQGEAAARNTGIHEATGEFLAFLDSDDLWFPDKLKSQMEFLDVSPSVPWVYSDAEMFNGETGRTLSLISRSLRMYRGDVLHRLIMRDFIPSPTPVIRREIFEEVGDFWPSPKATDWDMWLRIAACYPVGLVDKPLARYRIHQKMITKDQSWETKHYTCVAVIERAVARNPNKLASLKSRAMANQCIVTGQYLLGQGDRFQARRMFVQAIHHSSLAPQVYLFLGVTFLGNKILKKLIKIYRRFRNRK